MGCTLVSLKGRDYRYAELKMSCNVDSFCITLWLTSVVRYARSKYSVENALLYPIISWSRLLYPIKSWSRNHASDIEQARIYCHRQPNTRVPRRFAVPENTFCEFYFCPPEIQAKILVGHCQQIAIRVSFRLGNQKENHP